MKVISMNGWGTEMELVVPVDSLDVQSILDLKGRTIAIGTGSEAFPVFIRLLNTVELGPTDVTIKSLSADDLVSVLEKKLADAVFETRHFTTVMVNKGQARVVLSNDDITKTLGAIGAKPLVANAAFLQREPETAQKFVNGWVKGLLYIQQDPEDAARLFRIFFHREGTTVPEEFVASWVGMTKYDRYTWSKGDIADAEYNGWALKEGQVLTVIPELDGFIDNSFAQRAWDSLQ
jgi:ABC-type nitrate/sulfonate/bicarbonate transport system substrate-binding protein